MKKILIILFVFIGLYAKGQDYYAKDLPEYTAVANDSTDVLYLDDSGVDKHIEMPTLIQLVSDSTNQLRQEIDTAKTAIRSEIAGGGAWSVTGNMISQTSADDSVDVNVMQAVKVDLDDGSYIGGGTAYVSGVLSLNDRVSIANGEQIGWQYGEFVRAINGTLYFYDNQTALEPVSLYQLLYSGGDVGIEGTTPTAGKLAMWYDGDNIMMASNITHSPNDSFLIDMDHTVSINSVLKMNSTDQYFKYTDVTNSVTAYSGIQGHVPIMYYQNASNYGGVYVKTSGRVEMASDTGIFVINDLYYTGAGTLKTTYGWAVIDSSDNRMFADSSVVSPSYGLRMPIKNIFRYFFDRVNGELVYYYQTDSLTIDSDYGVLYGNESPGRTIEKLVVAIEHLYRRFFRMSLLILILFGWVGYQQYQIRKLKSQSYLKLRK